MTKLLNDDVKLTIYCYMFLFFFVLTPLCISNGDFWDGTIIQYASIIENYNGLHNWATESTWFLQYWLSLAIIQVSKFFNISYTDVNLLVVVILFCLLLNEVILLAKHIQINGRWLLLCSITFISFPIWHNFLSSVLTFHLICLTIGVMSIRFIHLENKKINLIGFLLLIPSLTFQSQIIFLPCLSVVYDYTRSLKYNCTKKIFISTKTILILLLGLTILVIIRKYFPPTSIYENYYSLIFNDLSNWKIIVKIILGVFSFLLPLFLIIIYASLSNYNKTYLSISNNFYILLLFLLFCSGFFPYFITGKFTYLFSIYDWNGRHAILLSIPASLLLAIVAKNLIFEKKIIVLLYSLIFLNIILLSSGFIEKLNRQSFEKSLSKEIKNLKFTLSPGLVQIITNHIPSPSYRSFEVNFILFKNLGKPYFWGRISDQIDEDFKLPKATSYEALNPNQSIFELSKVTSNCDYVIYVNTKGFDGTFSKIKNIFNVNRDKLVKITHIVANNC